jgi:hypothetical protein
MQTTTKATSQARAAQERWARIRAAGRTAFVWRYGVVGWGLPAGLLASVYHILQVRATTPGFALSVAGVRPLWMSLGALLGVCAVVGYLLGAWLWDFCEARFGE